MNGPLDLVQTAADRLRAERRGFVAATVVRADRPTSAKPGDRAIVLDDGSIVGFVGGECAQASVQLHALAALAAGEPRLLRIRPDAEAVVDADDVVAAGAVPDETGTVTVHNPCLSGGTLEIFLEPEVPPGLAVVFGDGPIARAVGELAAWLGFTVAPWTPGAVVADGVVAVVVASHGGDERAVLQDALAARAPYIGLVASPRRAAAVLATLDASDADRARISTPAGLDIGSRTPPEVALSILAEVVARRSERHPPAPAPAASSGDRVLDITVGNAIDPVCGMTVATLDSTRHVDRDGVRYWFCGAGCEDAFRTNPAAFVG
ncbi:MAG TPA: XdhC family protein [Acidimicrobiales bacterium]|nr:XdhC family protein [Acidimicrobiales bacterium]